MLEFAFYSTKDIQLYNTTNSKKSRDSGAGNFSEPRMMSQDGRVREVVCA